MNSVEFVAIDATIQSCIIDSVMFCETDKCEAEKYKLCGEKLAAYLVVKDSIERALEIVSYEKSRNSIKNIVSKVKINDKVVKIIIDQVIRHSIDLLQQAALDALDDNNEIDITIQKCDGDEEDDDEE